MNYNIGEKFRAVSWNRSTSTLRDSAKEAAPYVGKEGKPGRKPYDFCLLPEHAALSLLPEVRESALALFV